MAKQTIDTSGATDTLAAGLDKANDNFDELYLLKYAIDSATAVAGTLTSARLATAAALDDCTYSNGSSGVGAYLEKNTNGALTVDGVTPSVNDRIIVKTQSNAAHNGLYIVTTVGSGAAKWKLTRATDADTSAELLNFMTYVTAGTANTGKSYICRSSGGGAITFGTTLVGWMEYKVYDTDPSVAHFRSDGNNVTGNGSFSRPYGASGGQTAYNAGFKHFDVGAACDIGTIQTTVDGDELFFRGRGKSSLVYIQTNGRDIIVWDVGVISMYIGLLSDNFGAALPAAGDIVVHYGYLVNIGANGDIGTSGSGYIGYPGGSVTVHGPAAVSSLITANGGAGGDDGSAGDYDGGPGGSVWIGPGVKFLPSATSISSGGGAGINSGSAGAEGTIHLQMMDTGPVTPSGTFTATAAVVDGVPMGFVRNGNATLVAGTVDVAMASITADSVVLLGRKTAGGTLGNLTYTLDPGVGFTINSDDAGDVSVVSYMVA